MLGTDLRKIIYNRRNKNKQTSAIILSSKSFDELEDDAMMAYPIHGGNIMYMYGVAIVRETETVREVE